MTKLIFGTLTLLFGILISGVAAYFSVFGLAALFAAAFTPVIIMGSVLEGGKLVAAAWLHSNWKNPNVNGYHKTYLLAAIAALMLITATGIYGYLSKGHLEQSAPIAQQELEVKELQFKISSLEERNDGYEKTLAQLDKVINGYIENDYVTKSIEVRKTQEPERDRLNELITANDDKIDQYKEKVIGIQVKMSAVEAKLGPVKYVAALFGWEDPEVAVRMVILILMFAFDPLAVVLVISGTISIGEGLRLRKQDSTEKEASDAQTQMETANKTLAVAESKLTEAKTKFDEALALEKTANETLATVIEVENSSNSLRANAETKMEEILKKEEELSKREDEILSIKKSIPEYYTLPEKELLFHLLEKNGDILEQLVNSNSDEVVEENRNKNLKGLLSGSTTPWYKEPQENTTEKRS